MDEADNLVVGLLLTRGYVLYRDVFSHHFPFPYYWVAAIVSLFGKSIFAVRLSVWLFQIVSFGIAMKLSGFGVEAEAAILKNLLKIPGEDGLSEQPGSTKSQLPDSSESTPGGN